MSPQHHFWSSLAAGGALYWATGSNAALVGTMLGGFLIDADHIIDQLWSIRHGAPFRRAVENRAGSLKAAGTRAWLAHRLRPRKLLRLPLIFHSYELLAAITVLTLGLSTPFLIGLLSGYVLHLSLDVIRHHHEFRSPLFYLLSYRLSQGFRRDRLIRPEYL
ncbi:MAG: hypothetical protein AABN33_14920 [Acidobacteriota bacterium]